MFRFPTWPILAFLLVGLLPGLSQAEIKPGEKAPAFKLPGTDGEEHEALKDKITVVCFTSLDCPVASAYDERFNEFVKKYADKGVDFIAINVNDGLEAMAKRVENKGLKFVCCYDKSGDSAKKFGAKVTPHLFIIDRSGVIQYVGAFDNDLNNPSKHLVIDAVEKLLAGKVPEVQKTTAFGCPLQLPATD